MAAPTAVILGASADRNKFGNKSVRAHLQAGYDVYPVNPKGGEIEGLLVYLMLTDLPDQDFDRVSIYLPPSIGIDALDDVAELSVSEVWLNPGSDDPELLAHAQTLGLPIIQGCSIVDLGLSPAQFPG